MNKQVVLMICLFVVALGCGIAVGMGISRSIPPHGRDHSWLAKELQLTEAQQEQMRGVWSETLRGVGPRQSDRRKQFQKERDEAMVASFTPEQHAAYDKIVAKYNQRLAENNREREVAFQRAVERTKAILDQRQRVKYDELLKKGAGRPPWERSPATATAPATVKAPLPAAK